MYCEGRRDMTEIPQGWSGDDKSIAKTFKFKTFAEALGFMVEVGLFCEREDHHPEWTECLQQGLGRTDHP